MCQRASMLAILLLKETAVKSALCYKTCSKHLQLHPWAFQSCESLFIQTSNWEKKNTLSFFQLIWKIFGFSKQKNFTDCNQMEKKNPPSIGNSVTNADKDPEVRGCGGK